MLASDMQNPNFVGAMNPDSVLFVRFYAKSREDKFQSAQKGHPIFKEVIYCEIRTPGIVPNIIDTPMRPEHKIRFPQQWAQFEATRADPNAMGIVGTPLEQWPMITRERAEELKGRRFYTVEQIAAASDEQVQGLGMDGMQLRKRAQAYLAHAQETASAQQQATELAKRDEQIAGLQAQIGEMTKQMGVLMQKLTEDNSGRPEPRRGPGRPRKERPDDENELEEAA